MKNIFIVLFFLLSISNVAGQWKNANWAFGDSSGIDFKSGVKYRSSTVSRGSATSISDRDGNLQLYAFTRAAVSGNTTLLFNDHHQFVPGSDSIVGRGWYNELIILNYPGSDSIYVLITAGVTGSPLGLYYTLIDKSLNNGLGYVYQKNIQLLDSQMVDCLSAVKHGNGQDWWIIARDWNGFLHPNEEFYVFLLNEQGITLVGIQSIGTPNETGGANLTFSPDGNQFVFSNWIGLIESYTFDRCTGQISNPVLIEPPNNLDPPIISGMAYSPDGSKLYVSHNADTTFLYQYDMNAANIRQSKILIYTFHDYDNAGGQLRLAPDGKIYFSMAWNPGGWNYPYPDTSFNVYNTNLSVIHQPNLSGTACDFRPFSFNLGGGRTYWGLPNNPDYELGPLRGSTCDTITTSAVDLGDDLHKDILLYPNPVKDKLYLKTIFSIDLVEIKVFNLLGQKQVAKMIFNNNELQMEITTENLKPGLYLLEIITKTGTRTTRFIKE